MKPYDVLISDKAQAEMEGIYTYISETLLSPMAAVNQYERIAEAILSLETMPKRIPLMDDEPERSKGLRLLIVDNYAVVFVVRNETVYVTRVLYSASDLRRRLLETEPKGAIKIPLLGGVARSDGVVNTLPGEI